jgi:signal transduction histidine kinase
VAGESVPLPPTGATAAGPLTLPAGRNRLLVEFFAVHFGSGPPPRFQFRLEGANPDWSAPSDDRTVQYASLAPGRYRFLVRTVAEDGTPSDAPAAVTLRVLAPLWRRGWFQSIVAAGLVALAAAAYRLRVRRLLALERVRTRIATDLHDDIGSSLSRMAILSEVVRREVEPTSPRSADLLGQIADSARGLTESMADIVWSLDPRHDDLGHTIFRIREYAADVLPRSGISWTLAAPDAPERIKLSAERRRHLYLILKEAIHNVVKHAGASTVVITLEVRDRELRAEIRDDGRGLAPESTPRAARGGGHGLENMRFRAAQAGGSLHIESGPEGGTRVALAIPLA